MPHQATNSSDDALEEILQRLVLLDRTGLLQLQEHLVELISLFPAPLTEQSSPLQLKPELPNELVQHQIQQTTPLHGSRGGGGIEWKLIRRGDKVYGPYPYWRFKIGKSRRSIYLKQLAQESRQCKSPECQHEAAPSLKTDC